MDVLKAGSEIATMVGSLSVLTAVSLWVRERWYDGNRRSCRARGAATHRRYRRLGSVEPRTVPLEQQGQLGLVRREIDRLMERSGDC